MIKIAEVPKNTAGILEASLRALKEAGGKAANITESLTISSPHINPASYAAEHEQGIIRMKQLVNSFLKADYVDEMVDVIRNGSKEGGTLIESFDSFANIAQEKYRVTLEGKALDTLHKRFYLMFAPETLESLGCRNNVIGEGYHVPYLFLRSVEHLCQEKNYTEAQKLLNNDTLKIISNYDNGRGKKEAGEALCYYARHLLDSDGNLARREFCDLMAEKGHLVADDPYDLRVDLINDLGRNLQKGQTLEQDPRYHFLMNRNTYFSGNPRPEGYKDPGAAGTAVRPGGSKIMPQDEWDAQQKKLIDEQNAIIARQNAEKQSMKAQLQKAVNNHSRSKNSQLSIVSYPGATSNQILPLTSSGGVVQLVLEGKKCLSIEDAVKTICDEATKVGDYEIISTMFNPNTLRTLKQNLNEQELSELPRIFCYASIDLYKAGEIERLKQLAHPQVTGFMKSLDSDGLYAATPSRYLVQHVIDGLDKNSPDCEKILDELRGYILFSRCELGLSKIIYDNATNITEELMKKGFTPAEAESFYKDCMLAAKVTAYRVGPDGKEVEMKGAVIYDENHPYMKFFKSKGANSMFGIGNANALDAPKS